MNVKSPNPSRMALARMRRGFTKARLARMLGRQPRSISAFENGEFPPSSETLVELADVLRFPTSFFFGSDVEPPNADSVSFRALSRMKASERNAALGASGIALVLDDWISNRFKRPDCALPDLQGEDPEAAADAVRSAWGLGYRPITNLVHLLESKGVRIYSLVEDTRNVDAFSFWRVRTPFVFLNSMKSAERSRFDLAHELGHLVIHTQGGPAGYEAEMEANSFASAFLMPASSVFATVRHHVTLDRLVRLKKNWIVSVAALAYRLWKLKILSDWQYRAICVQMGEYRIREPEPALKETSQVLQKVFSALESEAITKAIVARELGMSRREFEGLTFGLVLVD